MTNLLSKKSGESLGLGLMVIVLSIAVFALAFIVDDSNITGFATADLASGNVVMPPNLMEFLDVSSLKTLAPGRYYIGSNNIVYWMDDESTPAIAKVDFVDESQKNRYIYIDDDGNVGYLIS